MGNQRQTPTQAPVQQAEAKATRAGKRKPDGDELELLHGLGSNRAMNRMAADGQGEQPRQGLQHGPPRFRGLSTELAGGARPQGLVIQPKLVMGQPNDKYEREVDRVAEIEQIIKSSEGGQKIPSDVQKEMEFKFNADFSNVRIHEGIEAEAIGALAFTSGTNLHFARGKYQPHTRAGLKLLGHELTHVIQQQGNRVPRNGDGIAIVDDPILENKAERMGEKVVQHTTPQRKNTPQKIVQPRLKRTNIVQKTEGGRKRRRSDVNPDNIVSERRKRGTIQIPRYFAEPVYGPTIPLGGGTSMKVTLGPASLESTNYGSVPALNTPAIMRNLKDKDLERSRSGKSEFFWKAGHLLNDNFGGRGDEPKNLTPLTIHGNKNHLNTIETPVKNLIAECSTVARMVPQADNWYGVKYEVTVGEEKWHSTRSPWKYVAKKLYVKCHTVKKNKSTGTIKRTDTSDRVHLSTDIDEPVDNTGYNDI